jgi:hypothetical protein
MVIRRISVGIYAMAALLMVSVLGSGLVLGSFLADLRVRWLEERYQSQVEKFKVLERHRSELAGVPSRNCATAHAHLWRDTEEMHAIRRKLLAYASSMFSGFSLHLPRLNRDFTRLALRYWFLSVDIVKMCGTSAIPVLHVYSGRGCDECLALENLSTVSEEESRRDRIVFTADVDVLRNEDIEKLKAASTQAETPVLVVARGRGR